MTFFDVQSVSLFYFHAIRMTSSLFIGLVSNPSNCPPDDLDSEIMINTPPAASIESGVESLTHSLSRLDSSSSSTHGHAAEFGTFETHEFGSGEEIQSLQWKLSVKENSNYRRKLMPYTKATILVMILKLGDWSYHGTLLCSWSSIMIY